MSYTYTMFRSSIMTECYRKWRHRLDLWGHRRYAFLVTSLPVAFCQAITTTVQVMYLLLIVQVMYLYDYVHIYLYDS